MQYRAAVAFIIAVIAVCLALSLWIVLLPAAPLAGMIMIAAAVAMALDPARGRWFGLRSVDTVRSFALAGLTIAVMAAIPWLGAMLEMNDLTRPGIFFGGMGLAIGGTFLAMRFLPPGWSALFAPVLLVCCIWAVAGSAAAMYKAGWQGLEWEPPDDGLDGTSADIFLGTFVGTVIAPVPGLVIGFLSQIGKRASATAPQAPA